MAYIKVLSQGRWVSGALATSQYRVLVLSRAGAKRNVNVGDRVASQFKSLLAEEEEGWRQISNSSARRAKKVIIFIFTNLWVHDIWSVAVWVQIAEWSWCNFVLSRWFKSYSRRILFYLFLISPKINEACISLIKPALRMAWYLWKSPDWTDGRDWKQRLKKILMI